MIQCNFIVQYEDKTTDVISISGSGFLWRENEIITSGTFLLDVLVHHIKIIIQGVSETIEIERVDFHLNFNQGNEVLTTHNIAKVILKKPLTLIKRIDISADNYQINSQVTVYGFIPKDETITELHRFHALILKSTLNTDGSLIRHEFKGGPVISSENQVIGIISCNEYRKGRKGRGFFVSFVENLDFLMEEKVMSSEEVRSGKGVKASKIVKPAKGIKSGNVDKPKPKFSLPGLGNRPK